ncbi:MAG: heme exporter protein CcmB [Armatimonadota bacterium]|nr:heme exporter protein CcmB [Armatimonadota bacterium]MDW8144189.1 heme exporter protein CcmB [Armatimonadota bacterium]
MSWERTVESETKIPSQQPNWLKQVWAIAKKDFQGEWRTRHAIVTTLAFALIALTVVSLSVGSLRGEPALAAGLLWVIIFFATIVALGRTFTKEVDAHTDNLLRLNAEPSAIFLGKMLFNLALLSLVAVLTVPLFVALLGVYVKQLGTFIIAIFLSLVTMAALGTILGAMLAKVQSRIALLAVAAFPLFFPALAASLQVTATIFGAGFESGSTPLKALLAYAGVSFLGGLLLFEEVW